MLKKAVQLNGSDILIPIIRGEFLNDTQEVGSSL